MSQFEPVYLAGPTAVGKSEIAILLAQNLGGEIISVDSMQVYRGLDIGTAKVSAADRRRAPHHLIDILDPIERFSAADFVVRARAAHQSILARGRVPIFCGGTGLYFSALMKGLGSTPSADPALRRQLQATPLPELLGELSTTDPATARTIDPHNRRRVERAIEVIRLTGRPVSEQTADWKEDGVTGNTGRFFFALKRASPDLYQRINRRVEDMFSQGLEEETRQLAALGLAAEHTALQAIGYRQVMEYLNGERDCQETICLVQSRTRQFARRQMNWFRRQFNPIWLTLAREAAYEPVVDQIARTYRETLADSAASPSAVAIE